MMESTKVKVLSQEERMRQRWERVQRRLREEQAKLKKGDTADELDYTPQDGDDGDTVPETLKQLKHSLVQVTQARKKAEDSVREVLVRDQMENTQWRLKIKKQDLDNKLKISELLDKRKLFDIDEIIQSNGEFSSMNITRKNSLTDGNQGTGGDGSSENHDEEEEEEEETDGGNNNTDHSSSMKNNKKKVDLELINKVKKEFKQNLNESNQLRLNLKQQIKLKSNEMLLSFKNNEQSINHLIWKIHDSLTNITNIYQQELTNIEQSLINERNNLINDMNNKKNHLRTNILIKNLESSFNLKIFRDEIFQQELDKVRNEDTQSYLNLKINLENHVQLLQQQLCEMRSLYQLNSEKLNYNYLILKDRESENKSTLEHLKRKYKKINEALQKEKLRYKTQLMKNNKLNYSLSQSYFQLTKQFKQLNYKFKHFQSSDTLKFNQIWNLHEKDNYLLLYQLNDLDIFINDKILKNYYNHQIIDLNLLFDPLIIKSQNKPIQKNCGCHRINHNNQSNNDNTDNRVSDDGNDDSDDDDSEDQVLWYRRPSRMIVSANAIKKSTNNNAAGIVDGGNHHPSAASISTSSPKMIKSNAQSQQCTEEEESSNNNNNNSNQSNNSLSQSNKAAGSAGGGPGGHNAFKFSPMEVQTMIKALLEAAPFLVHEKILSQTQESDILHRGDSLLQALGIEDIDDLEDLMTVLSDPNDADRDLIDKMSEYVSQRDKHTQVNAIVEVKSANNKGHKNEKDLDGGTATDMDATTTSTTGSGGAGNTGGGDIDLKEERRRLKDRSFWLRQEKAFPLEKQKTWEKLLECMKKYHKTLQEIDNEIQSTQAYEEENKSLENLLNEYMNSKDIDLLIPPLI